MNEKTVRQLTKNLLGSRWTTFLFANVSGQGFVGKLMNPLNFKETGTAVLSNARQISFGLGAKPGKGKGSKYPDWQLFETITITEKMVGKKVSVFGMIEQKAPGKKPTKGQQDRIDFLKKNHCIAGWADSAEGSLKIITDFLEDLER